MVAKILKHILVNKTSQWFPPVIYMRYLEFIGLMLRCFGNKKALRRIFRCGQNSFELVFFDQSRWRIVNHVRANRYLQGLDHAGERLYLRYGLEKMSQDFEYLVDVGANVGELARYFLERGKTVFCFEPDPIVFKLLAWNLTSYPNVMLFQLGLDNTTGEKEFGLISETADSSLIFQKGAKTILIKVTQFYELEIARKLSTNSVLKMDTEGNEPESLIGFGDTLKNFSFIAIDCGKERLGNSTQIEVIQVLEQAGFKKIILSNDLIVNSWR